MFRLDRVVKRYGAEVALEADLSIERGATSVVLGPSGCGKSTLLRLLIGLSIPDEGAVFFDGKPLFGDLRGARHRIGYVIQEGGLFPHLTARANVELAALHEPRAPIRERIHALSELVRLPESLLARRPQELSGGQRQRVSLMRALVRDPEVLLLDEPFGALDPMIRVELRADLRHVIRTLDKTVVLVTHDVAEAAVLADEVLLFDRGRMVQRGPLRALLEMPRTPFVTRFFDAQSLHLS
jgi:osmoprotectant transport system ATP-binding protein